MKKWLIEGYSVHCAKGLIFSLCERKRERERAIKGRI